MEMISSPGCVMKLEIVSSLEWKCEVPAGSAGWVPKFPGSRPAGNGTFSAWKSHHSQLEQCPISNWKSLFLLEITLFPAGTMQLSSWKLLYSCWILHPFPARNGLFSCWIPHHFPVWNRFFSCWILHHFPAMVLLFVLV